MNRMAADEALLALARIAMDASVRAADDLGGLSPVQLRALTALGQAGSANLGRLADDMGVTSRRPVAWLIGWSRPSGCTAHPHRATDARSA